MKPISICTIFCLGLFIVGGKSIRAAEIGLKDGKLAPCPATPNCVSSQASDSEHAVAPLRYQSSLPEAKRRLKNVLAAIPRTRIIIDTDNYLRVEFTSLIMRFVDDVEFYFDDEAKKIHVRSASRVGRSDFGVNRRRVEAIRRAFAAGAY